MSKPCVYSCGADTSRQDGQCQNCAALVIKSFNIPVIDHLLERMGGCRECGFAEKRALRIFKQAGLDGWAKQPAGLLPQMEWAELVATKPADFYVICVNCHHKRIKNAPGRPRKHETEFDRQTAKREYQQTWRGGVRLQAKSMFPTCAQCDALSTCIHWIGEHGEGPRGNQTDKWARILKDPAYALNFAGFCEVHKPAPYFTRASRGEVPKPLGWRQA